MGNKIYVGNLPFSATNDSLNEMFSKFGTVTSAKIVMDRDTNRSKGFGFVEMSSDSEAASAIDKLNGSDVGGRSLVVNEARPMEPRPPRSGGGGFGGGGGGGYGGGGGGGGGRGGYGGGGGGGGRGGEGGFRSPYGAGSRNGGGGGGRNGGGGYGGGNNGY